PPAADAQRRWDPFAGARPWELSTREEAIVLAIARATMPGNTFLPGGGPETVSRLLRMVRGMPADFTSAYRALLWMVELGSVPTRGRTFSRLSPEAAQKFLDEWANGRLHLARASLRAALTPIKYAHF